MKNHVRQTPQGEPWWVHGAAEPSVQTVLTLVAHACRVPAAALFVPEEGKYHAVSRFGISDSEVSVLGGYLHTLLPADGAGLTDPPGALPLNLEQQRDDFPFPALWLEWVRLDPASRPAALVVCDRQARAGGGEEPKLLALAAEQLEARLRLSRAEAGGPDPPPSSHGERVLAREGNDRYRLIAEVTNDALWDWDLADDSLWSSAWPEPIPVDNPAAGAAWQKTVHPEDQPELEKSLREAIESNADVWQTCCRFRQADDSYAWVELTAWIARGADGRALRLLGGARDVTRRREREVELRRMEERFARAFDANPDPMAIMGLEDQRLIDVNRAYQEISGYTRAEIIGRTSMELGLWVDREQRGQWVEELRTRGVVRNQEITVRLRNGTKWLGLASSELVEMDGRPCVLSVIKDITELRRLEEQLRQAQKMDAIGRLAGGIAHDFNSFLTIMHGYCEVLLEEDAGLPDSLRPPLLEMRTAADRAAGLTRQLLAFSRQQILRLHPLDLNRLIRSSERIVRSALGAAIDLRLLLEPELGQIQADSSQIDQIVLNLVMNARDAMPGTGSIVIETRNVEYSQPTRMGDASVAPGRWILLSVKDDGQGMSEKVRSRIFEPFYTTKAEGKGTGLGLATVFGIVKQTGGHVSVTSEVGLGTTFEILFPQFEKVPSDSSLDLQTPAPGQDKETILLVDDEDAIRILYREVLESEGYTVLAAADGDEAMKLASSGDGRLHLLITDLTLPKVGGRSLARTLRNTHPGIAVLYMSGSPEADLPTEMDQVDLSQFLQKPFTPARLTRSVRQLLGRGGHSQAARQG